MKYLIKYYYIKSDHMFAQPEFDHEEVIDALNEHILDDYICKQKDEYNSLFQKKLSFGFDYISNYGGIKISKYEPIKIKQL